MDEATNPFEAPQAPTTPVTTEPNPDARLWAMICHLSALSSYVTAVGGIVGPLICWLVKKDEHPFVNQHGKESLNFQISMHLYYLVGVVLLFCFLIGIPVLAVLAIINVVLVIVASIKANHGETYRYPMTIRFIS